ncbi:MAG TPA: GNAT family N-acetyltransferase [Chitinophagales bacterium]|nr:GNAT family N-acetyltransferase [Chitinophagales bacterium]
MSFPAFQYSCKHYDELTKQEFHQILKVRAEVFIVEQNCPYLDIDHKDENAFHMCIYYLNELIAYSRIIPLGISYDDSISIGRVLSILPYRRIGAGRFLMQKTMEFCQITFSNIPVKISAQTYLIHFYESFGFKNTGIEYLEDNIPHVEMIYSEASL